MNETARGGRSEVWISLTLAFLSLGELAVGIWALFLPRSFYEDFPFSGRDWVSTLGPYDEHLVRDVGEFNLAFGVLLALATIWPDRRLVEARFMRYFACATTGATPSSRLLSAKVTASLRGNGHIGEVGR